MSGLVLFAAATAIINGVVDLGDPAVVLLAQQPVGAAPSPLCTGTVISAHVVLTAAHCVAPSAVGDIGIVVFTGTTLDASATADQFLAVADRQWVPTFGYNQSTGGDSDDLGLVILRDATTIAPVPFNRFPLARGGNGALGRIV